MAPGQTQTPSDPRGASVAARMAEARTLTSLLYRAADRSKSDFTAAVAELGLSSASARALLHLTEPRSMRSLAEALGCDPSYVTGVADELERGGLARRVSGEDRRVKIIEATPRGLEQRENVIATVAGAATVLRLPPEQRARLGELLQALIAT